MESKHEIEKLKVINAIGQVLTTSNPTSKEVKVDMSSYANGIYTFKFYINNKEYTKQVVRY